MLLCEEITYCNVFMNHSANGCISDKRIIDMEKAFTNVNSNNITSGKHVPANLLGT